MTPKAKREDSRGRGGGSGRDPTVAGCQVVPQTFWLFQVFFFFPCKKAVGSLSNSKVWQHGNSYAIISRKRRGGWGEAEHRIARLLLFNSVIARLHVSWEHLHKTRTQQAALVDYRRLKKQTNKSP